MANNLEKYFTKTEQEKVEIKIESDAKLKEKYEKIKNNPEYRLSKLEEKISKTKANFEKRFDAFKKAVLEAEKNQNTGVVETAKEKAEKVLKENIENLSKELREKAEKKIPFIGGAIFDWAKDLMKPSDDKDAGFFDKIFGKVSVAIGTAILGFLGLKKGYEKLSGMKNEKSGESDEEGITHATDKYGRKVKLAKNEEDESTERLQEQLKKIETNKNMYSSTGFNILKNLSIDDYGKNTDYKSIFNNTKIKNGTFKDLQKEFLKMNKNGNKNKLDEKQINIFKNKNNLKNIDNKNIYLTLSTFFGNKSSEILFKTRLSKDNLKNILENKDGTFNKKALKLLGKEKLDTIKNSGYDYKSMTLEDISILVTFSFTSLMVAGLFNMKLKIEDTYNYITSDGDNITEELKDNLEERKNNLLLVDTLNLIKGGKDTSNIIFGGKDRAYISLEDLKKEASKLKIDLSKNENKKILEQLSSFLQFRDKIINKIKSDPKFNLEIEKFGKKFDEGLNLQKITYLYLALNGNSDYINSQDSITKGTIYYWIYKVLDKGNTDNSGIYLSKLIGNQLTGNKEILSEDDKHIIAIIFNKSLKLNLWPVEKTVTQINASLKNYLQESFFREYHIPDNISNIVINIFEGVSGTIISYVILKKLKILRYVLMPFIAYITLILVKKGTFEYLEQQIGKKDTDKIKKEFNNMLSGGHDITIKGKIGNVKSIEDIENFQKNPKEYNEKNKKASFYCLGENNKIISITAEELENKQNQTPVFTKSRQDLASIKYKGYTYYFDTGYQFIDPNPLKDNFNGKEINLGKISINIKTGKIKIGDSTNFEEIDFKSIKNILDIKGSENFNTKYSVLKYAMKKPKWYSISNGNLILTTKKPSYININLD